MVFLGVSIVLVSVSILIYRHHQASWPLFTLLAPWWQGRVEGAKKQATEQTALEDEIQEPDRDDGRSQIVEESLDNATSATSAEPTSTTRAPDEQETASPETTPKARSKYGDDRNNIPLLSLATPPSPNKAVISPYTGSYNEESTRLTTSVISTRSSPSSALSTNSGANGAMPPPPRPSALRSPPSAASSLRTPNAGPLPNHSPTATTASSLSLPSSMTQKPLKPRQKVLLTPGHSPLDWARLQKSGTDLRGISTPRLIPVPPSLLRKHNGRKGNDAWSVWQGKVYNITPYRLFHPGGENELMKAAGRDGSKLFMEVHPWVNWENMLGQCLVGVMVEEEKVIGDKSEVDLEQLD
ncbi:MAG: hypothetical protein M1835_006344 [Candelina submexicana]|nr:MAG: hypothetical protein M1835_006344 [Candelina submexicana]